MPFQIIQGNILHTKCDAIVNPTDEILSGSSGLDAQIHAAAGPELETELRAVGHGEIGQALLTRGYDLPCGYIIHTVAPWWSGGAGETEQLRNCYRSALTLARQWDFARIALPLIGSGTRGFPKETVLEIAVDEIRTFLNTHDDFNIQLVVHDHGEFQPSRALLEGLEEYRQMLWASEPVYGASESDPMPIMPAPMESAPIFPGSSGREEREKPEVREKRPASAARGAPRCNPAVFTCPASKPKPKQAEAPEAAAKFARQGVVLDESFSEMLMRKIDERGYKKDSECYIRANIDRRLFSKIRSDTHYHPKKTTAVALAVALELSLDETKELLERAGYTFSHSILFDVIVEFCITQNIYDIFQINELLFQYDQPLLGG